MTRLKSRHKAHFYRPQRSWAKVMFLQVSVILSTGGGVSASVHPGIPCREQTPPGSRPPPEQTPPGSRDPQEHTPPGSRHQPQSRHPPGADTPPPREADSGIRSTTGRYASYWNAFLSRNKFTSDWLSKFSLEPSDHSMTSSITKTRVQVNNIFPATNTTIVLLYNESTSTGQSLLVFLFKGNKILHM